MNISLNINSLPETVRLAIEAAQNKKASGITVIDLREVGAFTSYFVICTGFSTPQVQAICSEIEEQLHKHAKRSPEHREGRGSAEWALLDFGGFVVHVLQEGDRRLASSFAGKYPADPFEGLEVEEGVLKLPPGPGSGVRPRRSN